MVDSHVSDHFLQSKCQNTESILKKSATIAVIHHQLKGCLHFPKHIIVLWHLRFVIFFNICKINMYAPLHFYVEV